MKTRCYYPKSNRYSQYGGRGISVYPEWRDDFWAFVRDVGEKPAGMTFDRIDTDGDYRPGNWRWATQLDQQNNRRNNRLLEYGGDVMTVAQWARVIGLPRGVVAARLNNGWSVERLLTTRKFQLSDQRAPIGKLRMALDAYVSDPGRSIRSISMASDLSKDAVQGLIRRVTTVGLPEKLLADEEARLS